MDMPTEKFEERFLDGEALIMELYGEVGNVRLITLGNRFDILVRIYPLRSSSYQDVIDASFKFFRSEAVLLKRDELAQAWAEFKSRNLK